MTLCAGWISGDHAYLVVDSAVTQKGQRVSEQIAVSTTTFGETEVSEPGTVIVEGAAKLFRLSDTAIAAFAGDTEPAYPVLNLLRHDLAAGIDIYRALGRVQSQIKGFALGIAGLDNGMPRLWLAVDGRISEIYEPNRVWVWGPSRETGLPRKVQQLIGNVASPDPVTFLARALAAVQIPLATSGTIANGIGGAYFGASVSRAGVRTSSDVAYVFYEHARLPAIHLTRIVLAGWRDGVQYSQAFVHDESRGLFSPQTVVFESDAHFTDRNDLEKAAQSLEQAFPAPRFATLIDHATSTFAFVPLEDCADLMKVSIGFDRVECHMRGYLLSWIDGLIRSAPAGTYGLICVTKDAPPR